MNNICENPNCNNICEEVGKRNRFKRRKRYCCICYYNSTHQILNNFDFSIDKFCYLCKYENRKHQIITILGSTKFRKEIYIFAWQQTLKGKLVLFAPFSKEELPEVEVIRDLLESIHFQKIRLADSIYVYNKNGYIGNSTKMEIEYAIKLNKPIVYREKLKRIDNNE